MHSDIALSVALIFFNPWAEGDPTEIELAVPSARRVPCRVLRYPFAIEAPHVPRDFAWENTKNGAGISRYKQFGDSSLIIDTIRPPELGSARIL